MCAGVGRHLQAFVDPLVALEMKQARDAKIGEKYFNPKYQQNLQNGMSEKEAFWKAWDDSYAAQAKLRQNTVLAGASGVALAGAVAVDAARTKSPPKAPSPPGKSDLSIPVPPSTPAPQTAQDGNGEEWNRGMADLGAQLEDERKRYQQAKKPKSLKITR